MVLASVCINPEKSTIFACLNRKEQMRKTVLLLMALMAFTTNVSARDKKTKTARDASSPVATSQTSQNAASLAEADVTAVTQQDSVAIAFGIINGVQCANWWKQLPGDLPLDFFVRSFNLVINDQAPSMFTVQSAQDYVNRYMQHAQDEANEKVKAAGELFLAENGKKDGVVTLPSGVQYKVIKEGTGALPKDTSLVKVNYEGKTLDGKVFDSSYERKQPADFRANQVIKGWTDALVHMPAGSIWEVYIPQELAYGERQQGADIKPFSMLIFKIELLEVDGKK